MSSPASAPWPPDAAGRRPADRWRLDARAAERDFLAGLAADVRRGLTARPRWLPPKYFYDEAGSRLFDLITALPEYYLTRAEESILREAAGAIVERAAPRDIVELGPGSCRKVRWILDSVDHGGAVRYVPVDVGRDALARATQALAGDYPALRVHAVAGDFERDLAHVPPPAGRRLVLFLGSTIGNFDPPDRRRLLGAIAGLLGGDGRLLLGVDLVKDRGVLEAAYDDTAGVTREFNRNILRVVNRGLDGDFRPDAFWHLAFYDERASRIEMHLVSDTPQRVRLARLGLVVDFVAGDDIWTESSYKFTRESAGGALAEAGLETDAWYTDREGLFGLVLARPRR
jgi:L-histidine N-alpha-methyltransferase